MQAERHLGHPSGSSAVGQPELHSTEHKLRQYLYHFPPAKHTPTGLPPLQMLQKYPISSEK